jgi:hypothetical protein
MGEARGRRILGVIRKGAIVVLVNLVVVAVLLMLLEGAASMLFTGREIARTPAVPEHEHAEHDTLLGWVNLPNVNIPDMYGAGAGVRTNGQRFRNDRDFAAAVPAGTIRIICSGDSFTFGYGVGNDDVWCERLTRLDPRIETVNMGLGGYGVDQAYLWYRRDGTRIDHDIHLFAFLTADFNRMKSDRFMGYGKPYLEVDGDSIVVVNQPVPRTSWLARRRALHGETIANLNLVRLARGLFGGGPDPGERIRRDAEEDARQRRVVTRIFVDLLRLNESRGSRLVLVYFPGVWDYQNVTASESWREFVADEAARQDIAFIDMIEELRRVPPAEVDGLFAPNLHFSVAGNAWAAEVLHRRLAPILEDAAAAAPHGG